MALLTAQCAQCWYELSIAVDKPSESKAGPIENERGRRLGNARELHKTMPARLAF